MIASKKRRVPKVLYIWTADEWGLLYLSSADQTMKNFLLEDKGS